MEMRRRLKKVDANFISLVGKGANNKIIIFKSAQNNGGLQYEKQFEIRKVVDDQRMVYGIVYSPDEIDLQGDTASAEVIKDMAYDFMKNARTNNVDQQHNFIGGEGFVAESWLTKTGDNVFPFEKEGSWAVGIKVEKEETWQLVKSGEITGLSLAGLAAVDEVTKSNINGQTSNNFLEKIKKYFSFKKDFDSAVNNTTVRDCLYALERAVDEILPDESDADMKAAIMENVAQFTEAMGSVEISKSGRTISVQNLAKLKTALSEIQSLIDHAGSNHQFGNDTDDNQNNIQKNNAANNCGNGENEMTPGELKKTIEESIKPLNEKLEELEKMNKDIALRLEVVEKSTPGSRQAIKKNHGCENQIPIWT